MIKKAIKKAFENQINGKGFSIVEVLSTCPTNWGMSPVEAMQRVRDEMIPYYPLGVQQVRNSIRSPFVSVSLIPLKDNTSYNDKMIHLTSTR